MKYRIALVVVVAVMLVAVMGCATNKTDPIVGTWTLTSQIDSQGNTLSGALLSVIVTEVIKAADDNTFTATGTFLGVAFPAVNGTWSGSGDSYTFTVPGKTPSTGTLSGNTFTMNGSNGSKNIFTKS